MDVCIVATTDEGTRAALRAACSLGAGFEPRITLLIPHVVPYPQALDQRAVPIAFTTARIENVVAGVDADVSIKICVCRPGGRALVPAVPDDSVVVIGGPRRRWRPSREERLANHLIEEGRRVLLVDY